MSNCFWSKSFCICQPISYGTISSLKSISFTVRLVGCEEGCCTAERLFCFFVFFFFPFNESRRRFLVAPVGVKQKLQHATTRISLSLSLSLSFSFARSCARAYLSITALSINHRYYNSRTFLMPPLYIACPALLLLLLLEASSVLASPKVFSREREKKSPERRNRDERERNAKRTREQKCRKIGRLFAARRAAGKKINKSKQNRNRGGLLFASK